MKHVLARNMSEYKKWVIVNKKTPLAYKYIKGVDDIRGLVNPEVIYLGGCRLNENYDKNFWMQLDLTFRL